LSRRRHVWNESLALKCIDGIFGMRGLDNRSNCRSLFYNNDLESELTEAHPLRAIGVIINAANMTFRIPVYDYICRLEVLS
jgi:hypothetical protein